MMGGVDVGVVSYAENDAHFYIYEVQILPRYQRQGIGTAFLMQRIDEARQRKKAIKLKVLHENGAKNLYERMGFVLSAGDDTHIELEWSGPFV
jgi:ribosomal protein S18 acetylase RimI-like enzyme